MSSGILSKDATPTTTEEQDSLEVVSASPAIAPEPARVLESDDAATASEDDSSGDVEPPAVKDTGHKITMAVAIVMPFAGLITAIVLAWTLGWMSWLFLGMLIGGWILTGMGITVGFHRLLTHRSFETYAPIRAFWMAMGSLAVQGSPLVWCAVHRRHHELSDKKGDPHSPHLHGDGWWNSLRGLVHAHFGWLFEQHWMSADHRRYVPDLMKEPLLRWVDRLYYLWVPVSLVIPTVIGGAVTMSWKGALLGFLWGGLARVFMVHHITWSINSICHVFGRREYESHDDSRNNVICGILGHGEGWHNNHHAFPTSARHGLKWWQFDASWLVIRTMELTGLAWNVHLPDAKSLEAKSLK